MTGVGKQSPCGAGMGGAGMAGAGMAGAGQQSPSGGALRRLPAAVLITGALMDLIDVTIVNVALPTIRRDLAVRA